ncbi:hypothetical protein TSUD_369340 [Trifolium subterraneum]|uniref:F-box associated beta-propeller type 1 domain-containing protein n=1 Tax=Trifolium subterraneum TaxID=3900 RepID=A0A2Z6NVF0_TRISU|nr:hypothetical protein TSUD_369340 [Trifolium subterraneum]
MASWRPWTSKKTWIVGGHGPPRSQSVKFKPDRLIGGSGPPRSILGAQGRHESFLASIFLWVMSRQEAIDRHHVEGNWNDIWKAQSPHKTRHLLWRLWLSQLLENLTYQNGTVTDRVFGMCRNEDNAMLGRVGRMVFAAWNEWFTVHQLRRHHIAHVADPRPVRWEKPDKFENKVKLDLPPLFQIPNSGVTPIRVLGSAINGILCIYDYCHGGAHTTTLLWNPVTEEKIVIPLSRAKFKPEFTTHIFPHGFGYDIVGDDYKVIQYVDYTNGNPLVIPDPFWEIYSLKKSWIRLFDVELMSCIEQPIGAGKKGNIFFIKEDGQLACFDLTTGLIEDIGILGEKNWCQIAIYKKNLRLIRDINM